MSDYFLLPLYICLYDYNVYKCILYCVACRLCNYIIIYTAIYEIMDIFFFPCFLSFFRCFFILLNCCSFQLVSSINICIFILNDYTCWFCIFLITFHALMFDFSLFVDLVRCKSGQSILICIISCWHIVDVHIR